MITHLIKELHKTEQDPVLIAKALRLKGYECTAQEARKVLADPQLEHTYLNNIDYTYEIERNLHKEDEDLIDHLTMLEQQVEAPPVYFPHNADFRSRLYPLANGINQQQGDVGKSLLQVTGKPIGVSHDFDGEWPTALGWMKVHCANVFGLDKEDYPTRVDWVNNNKSLIQSYAKTPLLHTGWRQADKPYSFLASCKDMAGYWEEGVTYKGRVPIAMDGCCNGSQHYAMLCGDEVAGEAVALIPSDKPKDLYKKVADKARELVRADLNNSDAIRSKFEGEALELATSEVATEWLRLEWDRNLTKRPTMCIVYGLTRNGARQYIKEYLDKYQPHKAEERDYHHLVNYMRDTVWNALFLVITSSMQTMNDLQALARQRAKHTIEVDGEELPDPQHMEWTTPCGWKVVQRNERTKEDKVTIGSRKRGIRARLTLRTPTGELDTIAQSNAIAPNVIHSLDAAHLQLTVLECARQGIDCFVMIHDSFATCPADAPLMAKIIREQFVEMYKKDLLKELFETNGQEYTQPKGNLNPEVVKDSLYFFG